MIDSSILSQTAEALGALDLSEENDRLTQLNDNLARNGEADTKARNRIEQIDRELREFRGPDGAEVAAALEAGVDVQEATREGVSLASLQDERDRLFPALKYLRNRNDDLLNECAAVRRAAKSKAAEAVIPLVDAIMDEARSAAEHLAKCYAAIEAVRQMSSTSIRHRQEGRLEKMMHAAEGLIDRRATYAVPIEIVDTLRAAEGKGHALGWTAPTSIAPPPHPIPLIIG